VGLARKRKSLRQSGHRSHQVHLVAMVASSSEALPDFHT
jgi:hypothetical protein